MKIIEENLNHIKSIEQYNFPIHSELNKAFKIAKEFMINDFFLLGINQKLSNENIISINRKELNEIIQSDLFDNKEKTFLILCWGIYFTVSYKKNKVLLLNFFNKKDVRFFDSFVLNIKKCDSESKTDVVKLFSSFEKEFKLPGIGYAYFTKLFYFFSVKNDFPILDKWLVKSYVYLLNSDDSIENRQNILLCVYNKNPIIENKDFRIKRKKGEFYFSYLSLLKSYCSKYNLTITQIETFLFGWDLGSSVDSIGYVNPRILYQSYFDKNFKQNI
jgi:hypothetical protein